ncbi:MAG: TonB family protein [Mucilaginibacter sp.]|nr:TonB family protein [Mucilaginibacter sp.]
MGMVQYIILANLCLAVLLGFYLTFLKKETFFQLNRIYLLSVLVISFLIPNIKTQWIEQLNVTRQLKYTIQAEPITIFGNSSPAENHFTFGQMIFFLYLTGVIILLIHLFTRLLSVKRMLQSPDGPLSYSFFKKVYLSNQSVSPLICEHENIHAAQWHSADIILMEIVVIFNWFNPAVYFFRKELKNVHEFIADEGALRSARDKKEYAMLLISQTFEVSINNLVNTFFNQNLLKQRIMMIQKNKSRKRAMLKYALSAPLFVLMMVLSSATVNKASITVPKNSLADTAQTDKGPVFTSVEHEPSFPGGVKMFSAFLQQNIKYPEEMKKKKIEGKVFVSFIVEKDGSLSELKVLHEPGYGSGQEALRVLRISPKWEPGIQNHHKVRVQYVIPITFTLKS